MAQLEQRLIYLGDCEDAIDLYVSAFDANITALVRYQDTGLPCPAEVSEKIAYAELDIFGTVLRMADAMGPSQPLETPTSGIALVVRETAARQAVVVLTDPHASRWASEPLATAAPVEVIDPFGVLWCLSPTLGDA